MSLIQLQEDKWANEQTEAAHALGMFKHGPISKKALKVGIMHPITRSLLENDQPCYITSRMSYRGEVIRAYPASVFLGLAITDCNSKVVNVWRYDEEDATDLEVLSKYKKGQIAVFRCGKTYFGLKIKSIK